MNVTVLGSIFKVYGVLAIVINLVNDLVHVMDDG